MPSIGAEAWVAAMGSAGTGTLGRGCSIWHGTSLRSESEPIVVGDKTNVQDGPVVHMEPGYTCVIGTVSRLGTNRTDVSWRTAS
jgi:Carbonic anhydrases/acetyltransferases, isoleucine patch superfamily